MTDCPLSRRQLIRRLKKFSIIEDTKGRGGERKLWREVRPGEWVQYSLRFHGDSETIQIPVIQAIRRRLLLSRRDGVSDKDFYGK